MKKIISISLIALMCSVADQAGATSCEPLSPQTLTDLCEIQGWGKVGAQNFTRSYDAVPEMHKMRLLRTMMTFLQTHRLHASSAGELIEILALLSEEDTDSVLQLVSNFYAKDDMPLFGSANYISHIKRLEDKQSILAFVNHSPDKTNEDILSAAHYIPQSQRPTFLATVRTRRFQDSLVDYANSLSCEDETQALHAHWINILENLNPIMACPLSHFLCTSHTYMHLDPEHRVVQLARSSQDQFANPSRRTSPEITHLPPHVDNQESGESVHMPQQHNDLQDDSHL